MHQPLVRPQVRRGLVAAAALLVVTPAVAHAHDWPSFGMDLARSRRSGERSGVAFDAGGWRYQVPTPKDDVSIDLAATPAVADGFVVFATLEGTVRALRATDGKELWHFSARDGIAASPTIHRGRVFVGSFDRTLYALRLSDGAVMWSRPGVGISYASPTVVSDELGDGLLLMTGFPDRHLIRFDAATGKPIWQTAEGVIVRSSHASVAVGGGKAVVGLAGGVHHAFDVATGQLAWAYRAEGTVHLSSPLILDGRAYFAPGGAEAALHAVDLQTGVAIDGWPVKLRTPDPVKGKLLERQHIVSSPVAAGGLVLLQVRFADIVDEGTDTLPDRYDLREVLAGFDPASGRVMFQNELAARSAANPTIIPTLGVLPTPAAFVDAGTGDELLAVAVTMSPIVRVLRARTGTSMWQRDVGAATKSSPVMANGMLVIASDGGLLHALASGTNRAPSAPDPSEVGRTPLNAFFPRLSFGKAVDPEGDVVTYQVRVDVDGEVLQDWDIQLTSAPGVAEVRLPNALPEGRYGVSVRAADAQGALSGWSPMATFTVTVPAGIAVNGRNVLSLAQGLAAARPGDVVSLGAGRFALEGPARVRPGITLMGAGAGRTVIDAAGQAVGVTVEGRAGAEAGRVARVTIAGGDVGIDVPVGQRAIVDHVIVRDVKLVGVRTGAGSDVQLTHGTLVRNGTALQARGRLQLRNSLLIDNEVGVTGSEDAAIDSRFNSVARNLIDWTGAVRGIDDLNAAVAFVDPARDDFHVQPGQPTTDRGDPSAEFGDEPAPNGGRANLGAFGNTPEAEASVTAPEPAPPEPDQPVRPSRGGGCSMVADAGPSAAGWGLLMAMVAVISRRRAGKPSRAKTARLR